VERGRADQGRLDDALCAPVVRHRDGADTFLALPYPERRQNDVRRPRLHLDLGAATSLSDPVDPVDMTPPFGSLAGCLIACGKPVRLVAATLPGLSKFFGRVLSTG
jgi:hypothetical protein